MSRCFLVPFIVILFLLGYYYASTQYKIQNYVGTNYFWLTEKEQNTEKKSIYLATRPDKQRRKNPLTDYTILQLTDHLWLIKM